LGRNNVGGETDWDWNICGAIIIDGFVNIVHIDQGMKRPRGDKTEEKRSGRHWSGTLHHGIIWGVRIYYP
jgi:hypothetical protein